MRYSQMLIPTVKEVPADAEIPSHQLMVRAGLIRKVASGTYTYLPLGWRSLRKIMQIVREEMDRAGAQEVSVPILQPLELWEQTGRNVDYGENLCVLKDRHGRLNALSPTAEEVMTFHIANEISSYRQLPINLYQINEKFRDEFRPRFGVLRSREFIMKDAYSFDVDEAGLDASYQAMYDAYCRICERCGLKYVVVQAETGEIGGTGSQEFMIPSDNGEDVIVSTEDGSYAANLDKATVDPLPKAPAIANPPAMEPVHTPGVGSIEAVCSFLGTRPEEMIKTLIYSVGERTYVALVRGDHDVNEGKLRSTTEQGAELAAEEVIVKLTSAAVGFAGPMGLAEKVTKIVVDHAVAAMAIGVTGANRTDHHIRHVVPGRDFPLDGKNVVVADIRNAVEGDTCGGRKLCFSRGIEMGHVFKLGTKYSEALGATFLDEHGREKPCLMGCYGIGISRIMASAVELYNDENGIIWPISIAPFDVLITSVNQDDADVKRISEEIYRKLTDAGVEVLLDDRDLRGGVKFKDADLVGIPVRVTVGKRSVAEGNVEIKLRREAESEKTSIGDASQQVVEIVNKLKAQLNA